jgi:hypothetical protein
MFTSKPLRNLPFVFPVWVHDLGTLVHLFEVLKSVSPANYVLCNKVEQTVVPRSTTYKLFAIQIAACLPWRNGFEVWRPSSCDEPLYDPEMRIACEPD